MKKIFLALLFLMITLLAGCSNEINWDKDSIHYDYNHITTSYYDNEIDYEQSIITFSLLEQEVYKLEVIKYVEISLKGITKLFDKDRTYEHFGIKMDIEKLLLKYAVGTGVILTLAIIDYYAQGVSLPTKFLMAIAGANNGAVNGATSGFILGGAIGFVVEFIKSGGNWESGIIGAVEHSINGFLIGAIFGAIQGTFSGISKFEGYKIRNSSWAGKEKTISTDSEIFSKWAQKSPGGRDFYKEYPKGLTVKYDINGYPDFSPFAVKVPNTTNPISLAPYSQANVEKGIAMTASRNLNYAMADKIFCPSGSIDGIPISVWRSINGYTWHECQDLRTMILVPREINGMFGHTGGVGLINLLTGG